SRTASATMAVTNERNQAETLVYIVPFDRFARGHDGSRRGLRQRPAAENHSAALLNIRPGARLRPALAAVLEAETGEHCRHPDRRADALDHRHAQLLAQPVRLHVHRTLGNAVRDDDIGAVVL